MAIWARDWRWLVAVGAVFIASGLPILAPRTEPDNVALLWLPNAVLAVAYLRRFTHPKSLLAITVTAIIAGALAGVYNSGDMPEWSSGLGWAVLVAGDCLEAWILAFVVARFSGTNFTFRSSRDVLIWGGAAILGAAAGFFVSPLAEALGLASPISTNNMAAAFANWVFGDVNGHMTLGALLIVLTAPNAADARRAITSDFPRCAFIALALFVSGIVAFVGPQMWGGDVRPGGHPGYIGLLVPAMVWAAFRYGALGACAALGLTLAPGITLALNGVGPFGAAESAPHLARELQILTLALSGATLLIGILGSEARAGRDAALAADGLKTRFLSRIAHELRTPLNGVIGAADLLSREMADAPALHLDRLDLVRSSARTLASVVEDLVEFAAIARDGVIVRAIAFDPAFPFKDAAAIFGPRARWNGVELAVTLKGFGGLAVRSDPARWRQIVFNLVANAVEVTRQGRIDIDAEAQADGDNHVSIEFHVRDSGPGIAPALQASIFEPFVQGAQDGKRTGLGLGLAVAKETVEALGGTISVDSAPGYGADFCVRLRVERAALEGAAMAAGKARALLAEDNPTNRLILTAMLSSLGFDVLTVENGAEAFAAVERSDFALVVMDIQMPVMDGEEAIERIRALEGQRGRTPIIVITAHALPGDDLRFKAAGANGVLNKPVDQAMLAAEVALVLT